MIAVTDKEQEKRKHLIKTTYKLIGEKGFTNITLQDVADRAGVSKGIILYYFENKEALFLNVLEWLVNKIERYTRVEVSKVNTPQEKIDRFISAAFVGIHENREFYKVYLDFLSQSSHNEAFKKFNIYYLGECRQLHDQIVKEGIEKKVFRKVDLAGAAALTRSLLDGMCIRWLFDAPETFDMYRKTTLEAVRLYLKP